MTQKPAVRALKVFLTVLLLGPPVGGAVFMTLLQLVPEIATGFPDPPVEVAKNLATSVLLALPLSYVVGASPAFIAALVLGLYVYSGRRLTFLACIAASLVGPAALVLVELVRSGSLSSPGASSFEIYAGMILVSSIASATVCYLLLRKTSVVLADGDA
jgi:hypothetical protein